jgi:ankyrin repeat protein
LRDCFPPDIRRALEELPESLDATYKRTLLGIGNAKREYAHRLFQCLAVSIRPLRVEELAEVLAIRLDTGEDSEYHSDWRPGDARQAVLSACSSLIAVVNVDGSPVVQFSHFSVKEFLVSARLAIAAEHLSFYRILPRSAHTILARASLIALLNLGDQVDRSAVEKRPFAIYAARYWVDHGKFEGVSSTIQDLMERLFDPDRPYFATWVWIYDIDRPWNGSMTTARPTQPEAKPLYYAALCGFRNLVEHLIVSHQTDVNARGGDHGTALNAAFAQGEVEIARTLLQNGANINTLDGAGESSLHREIFGGHHAVVKLLLEHQADVNIQADETCETPLLLAARTGELEVSRLLLKHGADVTSRNYLGWSSLHLASYHGHLGIVEDLLVHGADVNAQNHLLWTPLHVASYSGHLETVQMLVRHGATLDKTIDQETPLHIASRLGNLEIARFLIVQGSNTMSNNMDGDILMHNASQQHGHLDLVEMLLEGSVDANVQNADSDEETPLDLLPGRENLEVSLMLIKCGADVNCRDKEGRTPLHSAARNGHLGTVRLFLNLGFGVQVRDVNHDTPLMLASWGGHAEVSRILVEHQADVNSVNNWGWTSLHSASQHGHADVVQLLLDHGADVNVPKADLRVPLHLASANGHLKVAELLIDSGADVDVRNEDQETPLDLASGNGELEVARLLVNCGSDVNSQDNKGWTPSHSAARNGHLSLVELLLDSGADIGKRNSSEKTPLDLAQENGRRDVASFLARQSGNLNICALNTVSSPPLEAGWKNCIVEPAQLDFGDSFNDEDSKSLHGALVSGRIDVIQRLLDRGADVNERNEVFHTPLNVVSIDGNLEIARTLIKYGADVNCRDNFGRTPLHLTAKYGHIHLVRLLLDNGADIHATQRENTTALHLASGNSHFEIVQLLLEKGANVRIRDVYGRTPSQVALIYGYRKVAQFLSAYDIGRV